MCPGVAALPGSAPAAAVPAETIRKKTAIDEARARRDGTRPVTVRMAGRFALPPLSGNPTMEPPIVPEMPDRRVSGTETRVAFPYTCE